MFQTLKSPSKSTSVDSLLSKQIQWHILKSAWNENSLICFHSTTFFSLSLILFTQMYITIPKKKKRSIMYNSLWFYPYINVLFWNKMYWSERDIEISSHRTNENQFMEFIIKSSVHSQDLRIAQPVLFKIWSFTFLCHSSAKSPNRLYSSAFIPHCINVWIYREIIV